MNALIATVLDAPLQAWCWIVCRPDTPRRADGRPYCAYAFITGSPGNPLRALLWWITDNSAFWRTPEPASVDTGERAQSGEDG